MQFEIYKSEPHWIPIRKSTMDGHSLKSASPYEISKLTPCFSRWRITNNIRLLEWQNALCNDQMIKWNTSQINREAKYLLKGNQN